MFAVFKSRCRIFSECMYCNASVTCTNHSYIFFWGGNIYSSFVTSPHTGMAQSLHFPNMIDVYELEGAAAGYNRAAVGMLASKHEHSQMVCEQYADDVRTIRRKPCLR